MEDPKITATRREKLGSIGAKNLRKNGQVPGSLYGHKEEAVSFSIPGDQLFKVVKSGHHVIDLELDGAVQKTMIQDVQWHVYREQILHCDLLRVDENERVTVNVALHAKGVARGVLAGGIMDQPHYMVPLECLAIRIPDEIVVRVNELQLGDSISVKDIEWPDGVACQLPENEMLLHIVTPKTSSSDLEPTEAGSAEPEVIGAKKEDEEE